jgi:hypothetical protein
VPALEGDPVREEHLRDHALTLEVGEAAIRIPPHVEGKVRMNCS